MEKEKMKARLLALKAGLEDQLKLVKVALTELEESEILSEELDVLGLSTRFANALRARDERVDTVGALVALTEVEVLKTPNLGNKGLTEIKTALALHNLALAPEVANA